MMVIEFDQEKFKQLLFLGNISPLRMPKYKKISLAKAVLANFLNHAPCGTNKVLSKPITTSNEVNKALYKTVIASTASGEAKKTVNHVELSSSEVQGVWRPNDSLLQG